MIRREDLRVRDPFIYVHEGRYWLYANHFDENGKGRIVARPSADLENWGDPVTVFEPGPDFWGTKDFFAPEMHGYRGRFYLFVSLRAEGRLRATSILRADSPLGPFEPFGEEQITPRGWSSLDGTLYVDDDGAPWMVFCHEWTQVGDGEMRAVPLKDDLSGPAGEPRLLFRAGELSWVKSLVYEGRTEGQFVTDAPWLYRAADGRLNMLWSSFGTFGYGVARAVSDSGRLLGPWRMCSDPVYDRDGGHCMLFTDLRGRTRMSLHGPNVAKKERGLYPEVNIAEDGAVTVL